MIQIRDVLDRARSDLQMLPVAVALGAKIGRRHDIFGCPVCGAERRHPSRDDRRGAIGCRIDDRGGLCHECNTTFDPIDYVALHIGGARFRELSDHRRPAVVEWLAGYLGLDTSTDTARKAASQRAAVPPPNPAPITAASYPPDADRLWSQCVPVIDDREVSDYLRGRGVDPDAVADRDLARALPPTASLPAWATLGSSPWTQTGHRLIAPMVDARGRLRSLLARRVTESSSPKSISPANHGRAGLVLACPAARGAIQHHTGVDRVIVTEGEIDFLLVASRYSDASESIPATLGIFSGSWSSDLASAIPDFAEVVIATDDDPAGDEYAKLIGASLRPALGISRWKPAMTGRDVGSVGGLDGGSITALREAERPRPHWLTTLWKPMGLDWLDAEPPPQRWLLRRDGVPVLASGIVGMLVAPGGRGKTMALIDLAIAVATGRDWLGSFQVQHRGRVVMALAEEDLDEVRRRIYRVAQALELTSDERRLVAQHVIPLGLAGHSVSLVDTEGSRIVPSAFHAQVLERVSETPHELVILDPLSRFAPQVEGDNAAATAAITAIEQLVKASNGTVIVAHHTSKWSRREGSKAGSASARGVTALTDGVRWVASLTGETEKDITLSIDKQNRAPQQKEPVPLTRNERGVLRPRTGFDSDMDRVEAAKAKTAHREALRNAILAIVETQPGRGTTALRGAVRERLKADGGSASNDAIDEVVKELIEDAEIEDRPEGKNHRYYLPEGTS